MISLCAEGVTVNPERGQSSSTVTGKVEELIYLGDHIRVRLNVCGSNEFIVKISNEGNISFKEGDNVDVSWSADDIRALDL